MAPATCCGVASQSCLAAENKASCGVRSPAPRATRGESRKRASRTGVRGCRGPRPAGVQAAQAGVPRRRPPACTWRPCARTGASSRRRRRLPRAVPAARPAALERRRRPFSRLSATFCSLVGAERVSPAPAGRLNAGGRGWRRQRTARTSGSTAAAPRALIAAATEARAQPSRMLRQRVQRCRRARAAPRLPSRYDVLRLCEARAQQAPEHARRQRAVHVRAQLAPAGHALELHSKPRGDLSPAPQSTLSTGRPHGPSVIHHRGCNQTLLPCAASHTCDSVCCKRGI